MEEIEWTIVPRQEKEDFLLRVLIQAGSVFALMLNDP